MEPARQKCAIVHPTTIWGLEASETVAGAEFFILNYVVYIFGQLISTQNLDLD